MTPFFCRFVAQCADPLFGPDDFVAIESLRVRKQLSSYGDWMAAQAWGGELLTRPDDDPDDDGFSNFVEYTLGGDPLVRDPMSPLPRVVPVNGVPHLEFNLAADPFDVDYIVEHSYDLVDWEAVPPTRVRSGQVGDTVAVDISDSAPAFFSRLRILSKLE